MLVTIPRKPTRIKTFRYEWVSQISSDRKFVVAFHFVGWGAIQLGMHIDWTMKNIEIFFPFGFFHLGLESRMDWAIGNSKEGKHGKKS